MKNSKVVYLWVRIVVSLEDNFDDEDLITEIGTEYKIPIDACLDGLE